LAPTVDEYSGVVEEDAVIKRLIKKSIFLLTPLFLIGCSSDDSQQTLEQQLSESSKVRIIHASPDAPIINIAIDVAVASNNATIAIDDAPITLEVGKFYTAIANNNLANIDLDLILDTPRRIATAAQVRIFHASSQTPSIDIYVTSDGEIADVNPLATDISYMTGDLSQTGYMLLPAGDYVFTVTPANSKTFAIETELLNLEVNKIYTAFAVNGETIGASPILIFADDF
jgi:hypothetical protein